MHNYFCQPLSSRVQMHVKRVYTHLFIRYTSLHTVLTGMDLFLLKTLSQVLTFQVLTPQFLKRTYLSWFPLLMLIIIVATVMVSTCIYKCWTLLRVVPSPIINIILTFFVIILFLIVLQRILVSLNIVVLMSFMSEQ